PAARIKPPQRFLLDGIQHQRRQLSIVNAAILPLYISPDPAAPCLPLRQDTVTGTDRASYFFFFFHQKCLTTSKRSMRTCCSHRGIPAFFFAMAICCSGVSTPSRFGSSNPLFSPFFTTKIGRASCRERGQTPVA